MQELIKTQFAMIGEEEVNSVDARELWKNLESKQQFANWIKKRIKEYGFEENIDFFTFNKFIKRENSNLTSNRKEYTITLDMAKELAMVENNEQGRKIRRYFIEVEKSAKQYAKKRIGDYIKMLDGYEKDNYQLECTIEELQDKLRDIENPQKSITSFEDEVKNHLDKIFITKLTCRDKYVIPTLYLAKRLKIKSYHLSEIANRILIEDIDFFKIKDMTDGSFEIMKECGFYFPDYCRNHNLYTRQGVYEIIKHLKSFE